MLRVSGRNVNLQERPTLQLELLPMALILKPGAHPSRDREADPDDDSLPDADGTTSRDMYLASLSMSREERTNNYQYQKLACAPLLLPKADSGARLVINLLQSCLDDGQLRDARRRTEHVSALQSVANQYLRELAMLQAEARSGNVEIIHWTDTCGPTVRMSLSFAQACRHDRPLIP